MFAAKRIPQLLLLGFCLISSSCVTLTSNSDPNQIKTAITVPHLTLYVRSPYTSPAQLVKIEKVSAEGTMICPYTKRPFYVPGYARNAPVRGQTRYLESPRESAATARQEAAVAEAIVKQERKKNENVTILHERRPDNFRPLSKPEATVEEASSALPSMLEPKLDDAATGAVATREPAGKLPYGIRVQGQKDFVRSPFAEAHQLVDVAGMPVGSEVKCPYSGRLFRVPPQE